MHHFCSVRFAKCAQNQPTCWVPCGLKWMHPDMQLMPQACQSIAMQQQGKWNMPTPIICSMNRAAHHDASFLSCAFCQIRPKPARPEGAVGPERDASSHAAHASSLSIHCHAPTRQMEHASSNHQLHGQRYTPQCVISVLHVSSKSAQNQPIQWVLWGLKGMHPDMQSAL